MIDFPQNYQITPTDTSPTPSVANTSTSPTVPRFFISSVFLFSRSIAPFLLPLTVFLFCSQINTAPPTGVGLDRQSSTDLLQLRRFPSSLPPAPPTLTLRIFTPTASAYSIQMMLPTTPPPPPSFHAVNATHFRKL
ncbi:unnamed protein product [Lactuca virosa]|uniref:Uncharacterized protein n=1 Tax=Lactuca virosa TaxID=75947 RepID=A0AAU9PLG3_9ASTR|nr:unnamed protein product [Lactuca virosa]